jgi:hypothetical protein
MQSMMTSGVLDEHPPAGRVLHDLVAAGVLEGMAHEDVSPPGDEEALPDARELLAERGDRLLGLLPGDGGHDDPFRTLRHEPAAYGQADEPTPSEYQDCPVLNIHEFSPSVPSELPAASAGRTRYFNLSDFTMLSRTGK